MVAYQLLWESRCTLTAAALAPSLAMRILLIGCILQASGSSSCARRGH